MTIRHGTEYAAQIAEPPTVPNVNTWHGRVRARYGTSPGETGLTTNDSVILFPIYNGERPLFFNIDNDTNTALLTADLGNYTRAADGSFTVVTENKYVSAQAVNTAANVLVPSISKAAETADYWVGIKFEAADPSDTADVRVVMYYVRD